MCILSFVLVIKGADFLVSGASAVAKHLCISDMVLGLTVVSLGTSLPENLISGLNLDIVQKSIEFHDDTIPVGSEPGHGATFHVSLLVPDDRHSCQCAPPSDSFCPLSVRKYEKNLIFASWDFHHQLVFCIMRSKSLISSLGGR
jgi:hypothetical protein